MMRRVIAGCWATCRAGCRRLAVDTGASEIAEAALILPLLFMFLLAIVSFGRAYNIYSTVTYAAHEGARVANSSQCATCGNTQSSASDVANAVSQVLQASKISPGAIQTYAGTSALTACPVAPPSCPGGESGASCCGTSGNVRVCSNVEINATTRRRRRGGGGGGTTVTGPVACGSTVSFQYPFQLTLPFMSLNKQILTLKAEAQLVNDN